MIIANACLDIFKLHKNNDKNDFKMEIILEPIAKNVVFNISREDYNRLYKRFNYMKGSETKTTATFRENIYDETKIQYDLKQEYKAEFRQYYMF